MPNCGCARGSDAALCIQLLERGTQPYEEAQQALSNAERWSKNEPNHVARLSSSLGAELIVEFTSLRIEST